MMVNIYEHLCYYDKRNPDCVLDPEDSKEGIETCYCDNCFRGKTLLAEHSISLQKELEAVKEENEKLKKKVAILTAETDEEFDKAFGKTPERKVNRA